MNLKYWDRHKAVAIITAIAAILFLLFANLASSIEDQAVDRATERAVDMTSASDAQAILRYIDRYDNFYEQEIPTYYDTLDSLGTIMVWIVLLGALYSAWTALDIPERYRKEIAPAVTPTPTTVSEPPE